MFLHVIHTARVSVPRNIAGRTINLLVYNLLSYYRLLSSHTARYLFFSCLNILINSVTTIFAVFYFIIITGFVAIRPAMATLFCSLRGAAFLLDVASFPFFSTLLASFLGNSRLLH